MEVSYGKEPFDLRLMCLRLCRNLWKILAVTVVGTLLFGGGYYVKNVVLQPDPGYAASSTYKVEYKENPNAAGAYYINEATWNTMIHTGEFLDGVEKHLQEAVERGDNGASEALSLGRDQWIADLSATLPSDFSVPVTQAATQDPEMSIALAHAVEDTMCDEFAESIVEIDRIKVLDHGDFAEVVVPDVRPVRAGGPAASAGAGALSGAGHAAPGAVAVLNSGGDRRPENRMNLKQPRKRLLFLRKYGGKTLKKRFNPVGSMVE